MRSIPGQEVAFKRRALEKFLALAMGYFNGREHRRMDSIKIRAWDFDDKQMIYLDEHIEIAYSGHGNFKLVLGSPFHDDYWGGNVSSYKLMLWTGLQDKNGKDVYEGDIVKGNNAWDNEGDRMQVVRYEGGTWNYSYVLHEYAEHSGREWEVIGNMYENPELLETPKEE